MGPGNTRSSGGPLRSWRLRQCREPGRPDSATGAQACFLDAYHAPSERLRRARVYEALFLIKLTAHRVRLFQGDWPQRTARLIGRAEAVLAGLEQSPGQLPPSSGSTPVGWAPT